jgi:hypothetical protein
MMDEGDYSAACMACHWIQTAEMNFFAMPACPGTVARPIPNIASELPPDGGAVKQPGDYSAARAGIFKRYSCINMPMPVLLETASAGAL